MGPEGLPVLLILFEGGCYVSILGSHFFWRGFKGRANAEGGSKAGRRLGGLRAKAKAGWFKGKAKTGRFKGKGKGWFKGKCWGN